MGSFAGLKQHLLAEHADVFERNGDVQQPHQSAPEDLLRIMLEAIAPQGADESQLFAAAGRVHQAIHATAPARERAAGHTASVAERRDI